MPRPRTLKLTTAHLRRLAAGESQRALARELGISDTALRKRLKDPIVADKVASLRADSAPESPSGTSTPKAKVKLPASKPPEAEPAQGFSSGAVQSTVTRRAGGSTSHAPSGDGRMHIGFARSHESSAVDQIAHEHTDRVVLRHGPNTVLVDPSETDWYRERGWR